MTHDEVQQLLGAYALDATSEDERAQVEAHLAGCAGCQAEVAAYRETAAMMALRTGGEAPAGLWDKIAASTFSGRLPTEAEVPLPDLSALRTGAPRKQRRRSLVARPRAGRGFAQAAGAALAVAAVAFASLFGVQVGQLRSQVHQLQRQVGAVTVAKAAAEAAAGPHATIRLATPGGAQAATVVVAPHGLAYWVSSGLAQLPGAKTYQIWGLVRGEPVSLALLGPNPKEPSLFRVESGTTKLMVTAEPAGGAPAPTTAVLAAGVVPVRAIY
jgi:anti-sigma factor RsiW